MTMLLQVFSCRHLFVLLHHDHANTNAVAAVIRHTACWLLFLFLIAIALQRSALVDDAAAALAVAIFHSAQYHRVLLLGIVLNSIADGWLLLLF